VGPWRIERQERLLRLRDLAEEETKRGISRIDFQLRFPTRDGTGQFIRPPHESWSHHERRWSPLRRHNEFDDGPTRSVSGDDELLPSGDEHDS